jgi:hypothetical protein
MRLGYDLASRKLLSENVVSRPVLPDDKFWKKYWPPEVTTLTDLQELLTSSQAKRAKLFETDDDFVDHLPVSDSQREIARVGLWAYRRKPSTLVVLGLLLAAAVVLMTAWLAFKWWYNSDQRDTDAAVLPPRKSSTTAAEASVENASSNIPTDLENVLDPARDMPSSEELRTEPRHSADQVRLCLRNETGDDLDVIMYNCTSPTPSIALVASRWVIEPFRNGEIQRWVENFRVGSSGWYIFYIRTLDGKYFRLGRRNIFCEDTPHLTLKKTRSASLDVSYTFLQSPKSSEK